MRLPQNSAIVEMASTLVKELLQKGTQKIEKNMLGYKFESSKDEAIEEFQRETAVICICTCNGTKIVLVKIDKISSFDQGILLKCGRPTKFSNTYLLPYDIDTTVEEKGQVPADIAA